MKPINPIVELLQTNGYKNVRYERDKVWDIRGSLYKPVDSTNVCELNDQLSIIADFYSYEGNHSCKLSIRALSKSGWIETSFYTLSYTDLSNIANLENKLLASWEALSGN